MKELKFDLSAMIEPKDDRDVRAMLAEALEELRSINFHLEKIALTPVAQAV